MYQNRASTFSRSRPIYFLREGEVEQFHKETELRELKFYYVFFLFLIHR